MNLTQAWKENMGDAVNQNEVTLGSHRKSDRVIVVMKCRNGHGAKGSGHQSEQTIKQLERG